MWTAYWILLVLVIPVTIVQTDREKEDNEDDDSVTASMSDEKRLIKFLLNRYDRIGIVGRPVFNTSDTVLVKYGLALIQILDLDEKNQVLTTNVWSRYQWEDILLTWDPINYGGVDHVRVPASRIWTPDIVLYNYADIRLKEQRDAMAVVSHLGVVMWIPMAIFKSTCSIDIQHFPFDEQECDLKFGSWTYDGFKLNIDFFDDVSQVDMNDYIESNEWGILEHPARKNVKYYPCCHEPYPDLTFTVKLKRIAAFYNYILILPCVLLSSLTLVIFWLPPESPAKMMLGINVFVAFFVLLLLLADSTPPAASSIPLIGMNVFVAFFLLLLLLADSTPPAASSVPLIGAYFCLNMVLITLSTFLSVIVINLYFRGDRRNRVPKWVKRLMVDGLARVMCMNEVIEEQPRKPDTRQSMTDSVSPHRKPNKDRKKIKCPELKYNKFQPPVFEYRGEGVPSNRAHTTSADKSPLGHQSIENDIKEIKRILRIYVNRLNEKDAQGRIAREWRIVARVLDRLFFFMYAWKDILLQWNPDEYGGIRSVRVPANKIWTPDIVLYNYADERLKEQRDALAVVSDLGEVLWIPTAILKSTCSIDILYFPYDKQECKMKFGSWTYDGFKLDLGFYDNLEQVDDIVYIQSNEWKLLDHPAQKNIKYYPCCHEPFPDLTFTIRVKRIPVFYTFILILPCILLSFLTLVIFWLPPESTAKMLLGMNIFVAFFLLLRILSDVMPPASASVPLIGAYFCLNLVLITLSSFLSVIVINLYHRTDKKNAVPEWVRKIAIDGLSRVFCLRSDGIRRSRQRQLERAAIANDAHGGPKKNKDRKKNKSSSHRMNRWETPAYQCRESPVPSTHNTPDRSPVHSRYFESDVKDIRRALRSFLNRLNERDVLARHAMEWRLVALVLDRLFFVIYLAVIMVALATIFPWTQVKFQN